jgi:regulator of sigma E protease
LNILGNALALVFVLSILVYVHEFGHFAVAKAFRFPVEVFSFGFGKRLFGFKRNGTDYRVSAIPLGGYVRVVGLGPDESTLAEGTSAEVPPTGKRWQRALILLAGPAMNLVLALVLYAATFAFGIQVAAYQLEPAVIKVVDVSSPGAQAGFQAGDRIVSINGTETPRWRDAEFLFAMNAREPLTVEVDRQKLGKFLRVTPLGRGKYDIGYVGLWPTIVRIRLSEVVGGSPAEKAGLKAGDVIGSIGGRDIKGPPGEAEVYDTFIGAIEKSAPGPVRIEFLRGETRQETMVSPRREGDSWKIGVKVAADLPEVLERFPVGQSFLEGWRRLRTDFRVTLLTLARLFQGKASMKSMSGPLDIAKFSGAAARTSPISLVALMAAISLQLGIFNLLPIPVLDGGHLFLLSVEGAVRRDFSLRVKERILQVGFLMIVALLVVVLYNDLAKNLPEKWWPF